MYVTLTYIRTSLIVKASETDPADFSVIEEEIRVFPDSSRRDQNYESHEKHCSRKKISSLSQQQKYRGWLE